eukprot:366519-Chlamydomonas_euryale.AAC.18
MVEQPLRGTTLHSLRSGAFTPRMIKAGLNACSRCANPGKLKQGMGDRPQFERWDSYPVWSCVCTWMKLRFKFSRQTPVCPSSLHAPRLHHRLAHAQVTARESCIVHVTAQD